MGKSKPKRDSGASRRKEKPASKKEESRKKRGKEKDGKRKRSPSTSSQSDSSSSVDDAEVQLAHAIAATFGLILVYTCLEQFLFPLKGSLICL